ncbi:hypothetical protein SCE1572_28015 [Sorangium cellulosum So0157-2]|uniref:Uncharacterized protein n=1 Tax=Sorangium cellulosum So0157-2 TaxID=1254432 RepID=S4XXT0_SORCE|nr:hypothetical protein SCE1572_28015 [Sorangium cellulosum So0157-2]
MSSRQSASSASYRTPRISPSCARLFGHRVIADNPAMENPAPRTPSPALPSCWSASRGSTPARPWTAVKGITYTASPLLVTENVPAVAPAETVVTPGARPALGGALVSRVRQAMVP